MATMSGQLIHNACYIPNNDGFESTTPSLDVLTNRVRYKNLDTFHDNMLKVFCLIND